MPTGSSQTHVVERESWVRALAQNREEARGISLASFVSFLLISRLANQSVVLAGPANGTTGDG
jgi:hypothetical protein